MKSRLWFWPVRTGIDTAREDCRKPRAPAPRRFAPATHRPIWQGRCPTFRPRTEADRPPTKL